MEKQRIRIVDIAEQLGVSTATVSNVIHGKTAKISDTTVKMVQQKLEEMQYIPNMAGILLAQNNSRIIGVLINDHPKYEGKVLEDGFISASLNALVKVTNEAGYFMMVQITTDWNEVKKIASMWNMDGIILIGFCEADYQNLRDKMHIPFVVYDGFFQTANHIVNLTIDHFDGGYQAGKFARERGFQKAMCLSDNHICMDLERMEGFQKGFGNEVFRCQVPMKKSERIRFYEEHFDEIIRYPLVFAVSDFYAAEYIRFMQSKGKRVPEDISVIGFDGSPIGEYCVPALTTIRQDSDLRAKEAMKALEGLKNKAQIESPIVLPVELVVRESVAEGKAQ